MSARDGIRDTGAAAAGDLLHPTDRLRLMIAKDLAAGMMTCPNTYDQAQWQRDVVINSLQVADKLILAVTTGGC